LIVTNAHSIENEAAFSDRARSLQQAEICMSQAIVKAIAFFAVPSNSLFALALLGLVTWWWYPRCGRWLTSISVGFLFVAGLLPIGAVLSKPLEDRFPNWQERGGAPTGFVVLGAASLDRLVAAAHLARKYPSARIVLTGGNGSDFVLVPLEADFMAQALRDFGVAAERIELESQSRNTAENASLSKSIARPQPGELWLLVTSPIHMPRAIGAFRQAGFPVDAYPARPQNLQQEPLRLSDRISAGLVQLDVATHEWQGLAFYWLSGQSAELLPGQEPSPLHPPAR
jgi:uncharacterized SAM-binding protein YcdF (DUF218 family)